MSHLKSEVAQNILSYLGKNPDASDTPEGIAKWWLEGAYSLHEVRAALAELVEAGLVAERRAENSNVHYRKGGDAR